MSAPLISRILREATALLAAFALVLAGLAAAVRPHQAHAGPAFAGLPVCAPAGSDDGTPASPEGCQHCTLCNLAALAAAVPAPSVPLAAAGLRGVAILAQAPVRTEPAFDARGPPLS
jgi:hypothetical protein